jgi:hypothetical protein
LSATAAAGVLASARAAQRGGSGTAPIAVRYPDPDVGIAALPARAQAQRDTVSQFKVPYDFQFADHFAQSGITFVHRVVDDAGLYYKPVHYDHGSGIAAADVDGDGLVDLYFVLNNGGEKFLDSEFLLGVEPPRETHTRWFDVDCSSPAMANQ